MVPSPPSGTGCQARSWQAGQNCRGGMASSPHFPQRTPVSWPSRARWKKRCSVFVGSVTTEQAHEHGGVVAAEGVGEADGRVAYLTRARLAAELGDDLRDLRRARRADRVPFGLEAARRVDGDGAAEARQPLGRGAAARARLEEAEPFRRGDLGDR